MVSLARISHMRDLVVRDRTVIASARGEDERVPGAVCADGVGFLGVSGALWVGLPRFFCAAAKRQAVVTRRAAASRHSSA
jgi:hypothetical protein